MTGSGGASGVRAVERGAIHWVAAGDRCQVVSSIVQLALQGDGARENDRVHALLEASIAVGDVKVREVTIIIPTPKLNRPVFVIPVTIRRKFTKALEIRMGNSISCFICYWIE